MTLAFLLPCVVLVSVSHFFKMPREFTFPSEPAIVPRKNLLIVIWETAGNDPISTIRTLEHRVLSGG